MTKKGFKPIYTKLHKTRAKQFHEQYVVKGKREITSDIDNFMKWLYNI